VSGFDRSLCQNNDTLLCRPFPSETSHQPHSKDRSLYLWIKIHLFKPVRLLYLIYYLIFVSFSLSEMITQDPWSETIQKEKSSPGGSLR